MQARSVFLAIIVNVFSVAVAQDVPPGAAEEAARLREIEERRQENARIAEELRTRKAAAEETLAILKGQLVEIAEKLQADEARMTALEERLLILDQEEARSSVDLEEKQLALSHVLAALQSLERSRPPALAVSPEDVTNAAVAAAALSSVTPDLREQAQQLRSDLQRIAELRDKRRREQIALSDAEQTLNERRRSLEDLLNDRESVHRQDAARLADIEREDARLAAEATDLRELIAGIERRAETPAPTPSVGRVIGGSAVYSDLPRQFSQARSRLQLPAVGRVVSFFGDKDPTGETYREMSISTRPRAVITAPFRGKVAWAEPFGRLGNVVILDVGEGYRLVLIGLGRLEVRRGELVGAGEPLGTMASEQAGLLRFQLRRDNIPIDPLPWLRPTGRTVLAE